MGYNAKEYMSPTYFEAHYFQIESLGEIISQGLKWAAMRVLPILKAVPGFDAIVSGTYVLKNVLSGSRGSTPAVVRGGDALTDVLRASLSVEPITDSTPSAAPVEDSKFVVNENVASTPSVGRVTVGNVNVEPDVGMTESVKPDVDADVGIED